MWWAIVTLGTVGYGDVVPVTPTGKLLAAVAIFTGFIMVALPVGIVASAFSNAIHRRDFVVTWGMLARVPLFANLNASEISDIMRLLRARKYGAGDLVARRGDVATSMYFVADGEVSIDLRDGDKSSPITMGAGHFFGEVAVLRKARRSATVRSLTNSRLLVLDAHDLHDLMLRNREIAQEIHKTANSRVGAATSEIPGDLTTEELAAAQSEK
jgi:voltage-gated potassium channel